jgi:CMP-N,N'-diacetyllegionaminic acid synthase
MKFHESKRFSGEGKQKVVLVDIDETICFYSSQRRYDLSEPNFENIAKINKMYNEGWKVIYWTARGSVSGKDYSDHTLSQLNEWGCKYHDLITGTSPHPKPHFDLIIDDKAKRIEEI